MSKPKGIGKGGAQLFAVDKFGVADEVLEMHKDGVPATKISAMLELKGVKIAPVGINRWIKKQKINLKQTTTLQNTEKFEMMVVDYKNEITSILDEVKEMKAIAKDEKDLDTYVKLIGKLFQGLELLAKLMGDIKPSGAVDIKVIINEITKSAFDENKDKRNAIFNQKPIVDAEFEIMENDAKEKAKLRGEEL